MTALTPRRIPERELRVAHVVRQFAPAVGGLEEAVLKLCLALRRSGVASSVVTLDRIARHPASALPADDQIHGIPISRIPFRGSWRYPLAPHVLKHLARADVVHVHAIDFFFDYLAATRPLHRKPLIASTHGGFFHTPFAQRLKQVYFQTVTRASALAYDAICASSRSDFDLFRKVAPGRLHLVENGVDTDKWPSLAPETPVRSLLAIGRFASHKQLAKLFPVLQALLVLDPRWRLTIAGRAWDVTPDELRQAAAAANVADTVRILTDPTDAAIAEAVADASYIVSASSHEGFGLGVVEGMAGGLVPVLNDISPFRDLITRSGCGTILDVEDPPWAARCIARLHAEGLAAPGVQRTAAIRAAAQFSWSGSAELFRRHYDAALQARPSGMRRSPTRTA